MRLSSSLLVLIAAGLLTACATQGGGNRPEPVVLSKDAAKAASVEGGVAAADAGSPEAQESRVVCEQVTKLGSHLKRTVCYTRSESTALREDTQDEWRRQTQGGPYADPIRHGSEASGGRR